MLVFNILINEKASALFFSTGSIDLLIFRHLWQSPLAATSKKKRKNILFFLRYSIKNRRGHIDHSSFFFPFCLLCMYTLRYESHIFSRPDNSFLTNEMTVNIRLGVWLRKRKRRQRSRKGRVLFYKPLTLHDNIWLRERGRLAVVI